MPRDYDNEAVLHAKILAVAAAHHQQHQADPEVSKLSFANLDYFGCTHMIAFHFALSAAMRDLSANWRRNREQEGGVGVLEYVPSHFFRLTS